MRKLGTITIGQSPRVDIVPELQTWLGADATFVERGALDGLTRDEITEMAPTEETEVLVTRMQDGSSVTISDHALIPRIQAALHDLAPDVSAILLLCTGTFPALEASVPVLVPESLLQHFVQGVAGSKPFTLGVLTPSEEQFPQQEHRWQSVVSKVVLRAASPYDGLEPVLAEGRKFAEDGVDAVLLDCMGYTGEMKDRLREQLPCPVILSRSVLARVAAELA